MGTLCIECGYVAERVWREFVGILWRECGYSVGRLCRECGDILERLWLNIGNSVEQLWGLCG